MDAAQQIVAEQSVAKQSVAQQVAAEVAPSAPVETRASVPAAVVKAAPQPDHWQSLVAWSFEQDSVALGALLGQLGHLQEPVAKPCVALAERGLRCELVQLDGWADLESYRTPALLELAEGSAVRWVIVLSVSTGEALVLGRNGERPWRESMLAGRWTGRALVPWLAPPGYRHPLRRGSYGPAVSWLAQGFARLDGQQQVLADSEYNVLLERRVRLFQREQALFVDGVAGFRTLLRLQQTLAERPDGADIAMLGKGG